MVDQVTSKRGAFGRFMAFFLALLLCLQAVPLSAFAAESSGDAAAASLEPTIMDGLEFSIQWADEEDVTHIQWDSAQDETREVRLSVNYASTEVTDGYEAGAIEITVPGIGKANREGTLKAADVSADAADATEKIYDWSYAYDEEADVYTFTNNHAIEANANFSGSFEILWTLSSRSTIGGYEQDVTATLKAQSLTQSTATELASNTVSFAYTSQKDTYSIDGTYGALESADGLGSDYEDYIWVEYELESDRVLKSRGLTTAEYRFYLPEGAKMQMARDYDNTALSKVEVNDGSVAIGVTGNLQYWYSTYQPIVIVGYPKATYDGVETTLPVKLVGTYADSSEVEVVAEKTFTHVLNAADYDFTYTGNLYSVHKYQYRWEAVYYNDLFEGGEVEYELQATARVLAGSNYTVSVIDDFQEVDLNDGSLHQLAKGEYEITDVVVPSIYSIVNGNGQVAEKGEYECQVWVKTADAFELHGTYEVGYSEQYVELPSGVYEVKFSFPQVNETMVMEDLRVVACYSLPEDLKEIPNDSDEEIGGKVSDTGDLRNLVGLEVTTAEGTLVNEVDLDSYLGWLAPEVAERDLATYGHYVQRAFADVIINPNDNSWQSYTEVEASGKADGAGKFATDIVLKSRSYHTGDDPQVERLVQYTILPEGMAVDEDAFAPEFSVSGIALSTGIALTEDWVSERCDLSIVRNYQGSGRTYIALAYDFRDDPIVLSSECSLNAYLPAFVSAEAYLEFGGSYRVEGVTLFDQASDGQKAYTNGAVDDGAYFTDSALWSDLDGDGDTAELVTYAYDELAVTLAVATHQEAKETARSPYSEGEWLSETYTGSGEEYSWRLQLTTGSTTAHDLVFFDGLRGEGEWDGVFQGVDTAYLEEKGYVPSVYYSADTAAAHDLSDAAWVESGAWTQGNEAVAAVAVFLEGQTVPAGSLVYAVVNMVATDDEAMLSKRAVDSYSAVFDVLDGATGAVADTVELHSGKAVVNLFNDVGTVVLTKTDEVTGRKLAGAHFDLYKADGTLVAEDLVTNGQGEIEYGPMAHGSYYFVEIAAPAGYELDSNQVPFTLDGEMAEVSVTNAEVKIDEALGNVTLTKVAAGDSSVKLRGAVFNLCNGDGELLMEGLSTDAAGNILLTGLEWGSYYFQETAAPAGYALDEEKIWFAVNYLNAGTMQYLTAENEPAGKSVVVTKRIAAEDVHWAHGNPTFIFQLSGIGTDGVSHTYYQQIRFNDDVAADAEGYYVQSATFEGFPPGEYVLSERESARYRTESVTSENGAVEGSEVTFDLTAVDEGEAVFTNEKTTQGGLSDTQSVLNSAKTAKKLVDIEAEWTGGTVISSEYDLADLVVTAVYDDGTTAEIGTVAHDESYTEVFGEGDFTGESSYPWVYDAGIWSSTNVDEDDTTSTMSTTFTLENSGTLSFDWAVSCETTWDYLYYTLTDEYGTVVSGTELSKIHGNESVSSVSDLTWNSISMKLDAGTYTLKFDYYKDFMAYAGLDKGFVRNVTVSSTRTVESPVACTPGTLDYEVDGDYSIDVSYTEDGVTFTDNVVVHMEVPAYALLYSDGSMVFQRGNVADESKTAAGASVVAEYTGFEDSQYSSKSYPPWYSERSSIKTVVVEDAIAVESTAYWFYTCYFLSSADLSMLDTSNMVASNNTFAYCGSLESVDISGWVDNGIKSMGSMFYSCDSLVAVELPDGFGSYATSVSYMFSECTSLESLALPDGFAQKPNDFAGVFQGCSALETLDLGEGFGAKATRLYSTFQGCSSLVNLTLPSDWSTAKVTNMYGTFKNCAALTLDCSGWNVSRVVTYDNFNTGAPGVTAPTWVN